MAAQEEDFPRGGRRGELSTFEARKLTQKAEKDALFEVVLTSLLPPKLLNRLIVHLSFT